MAIQQEVLAILDEVLNLDDRVATMHRGSPLYGALPELDSMSVVAVIGALEERFGFTVHVDELDSESFSTVGALSDFVESKLNEVESAAQPPPGPGNLHFFAFLFQSIAIAAAVD